MAVVPNRHFRGDSAAASLKPLDDQLAGASEMEFPRRFRRGLIEARRAMPKPAWRSRFPRRFRRGLIEACGVDSTISTSCNDFRGDSAAASLKRGIDIAHRHLAALFPRRFRRGLIEAPIAAQAHFALAADFRGDSAAASLKQTDLSHDDGEAVRFPRRFRRGLIEALIFVAASPCSPAFPRRFRRGLIEATIRATILPTPHDISAAIPPRPH